MLCTGQSTIFIRFFVHITQAHICISIIWMSDIGKFFHWGPGAIDSVSTAWVEYIF